MSRVTIFDKDGYWIGDIRANTTRSWILNANPNPGECSFSVSRFDSKCTKQYLEIGNYVLVRHSTLPAWVGIILVRSWGNGFVDIRAIQAEYILKKRKTSIATLTGAPGALFKLLLDQSNNEVLNDKRIYPNNLFIAPPERTIAVGNNVLSHIQELAKSSANDFDITYNIDVNNRLSLYANWYQRKGEVINVTLSEGYNIQASDNVLTEDGREMSNLIEARSSSSTDNTRRIATRYDVPSIAQYGLFQDAVNLDSAKTQVDMEQAATNVLLVSKYPAHSFDLTALNLGDTFRQLNVGNICNIDLNTAGFDGNGLGTREQARIYGMEYDDISDTCRLILEKYSA